VSRRAFAVFALVALVCFGCDQVSKELARTQLEPLVAVPLIDGFVDLRLAENRGAFLGMGDSLPEGLRIVAFQIAVPCVLVLMSGLLLRRATPSQAIAVALVLGGGAGNWIDRVLNEGAVTDFLEMGVGRLQTGIFNLADVAIMAGAALLVLQTERMSRKSADEPTSTIGGPPA